MRYVLPIPSALRGRLLDACRLYAHPTAPEPPPTGGFVLLDSGAYALSLRGGQMTPAYLRRLAAHYALHGGANDGPVLAVAPDVYLDPGQSIRQWRDWCAAGGPPVVPVIQCHKTRAVDLHSIATQCAAYGRCPVVCFSNPGLRAVRAAQLPVRAALHLIRQRTGARHIHILGAGWDLADVRGWRAIGGFDSMDSIAYYTAAQQGEPPWDGMTADPTWPDLACRNAAIARAVVGDSAINCK